MAVTDPGAEVRIRELRRRVTQDPTSPLFLALAEECRAAGNLPEAILILEKGVSTYARYVSAQVSLGRAYLEAGRIEESIAMLSRALASDGGNPVAARSLADIHLSRCERVEAVKKYKLYRALSGDRSVDEIIQRIERDLGPAPEPPGEPRGRVLADLYFAQGPASSAGAPDGNPARRQARIQALKRWLSVIQEHSHRAAPADGPSARSGGPH